MAIAGLLSLFIGAALPIGFVFLVTHQPKPRSLALAIVLSPLCTLLLGWSVTLARYGMNPQRGLFLEIFTARFVGVALLLFFAGWWALSFRWLERRAARQSAS